MKTRSFRSICIASLGLLAVSCTGGGSGSTPQSLQKVVFNDSGVFDSLGAFEGLASDSISLLVKPDPTAPEGQNSLEVAFSVGSAGWAGLFFEVGSLGGTESEDLSAFSAGELTFWIRSNVDVEIGMRSANIAAGTEDSKVWIEEGYATLTGEWQEVVIPIEDFQVLEPELCLQEMVVLFVASFVGPHYGSATSGTIWLDDIRWIASSATETTGVSTAAPSSNVVEPREGPVSEASRRVARYVGVSDNASGVAPTSVPVGLSEEIAAGTVRPYHCANGGPTLSVQGGSPLIGTTMSLRIESARHVDLRVLFVATAPNTHFPCGSPVVAESKKNITDLLVDPNRLTGVIGTLRRNGESKATTVSLPISPDRRLRGLSVYLQGMTLTKGPEGASIELTNAMELRIGESPESE